jgi:PTH2 family peptidyl-tRNA hydrolase
METKQAIVIRRDLGMSKGKCAVQASHASVEAVLRTLKREKEKIEMWRKEGMKKVVLGVDNLDKLVELKKQADQEGLIAYIVRDAGRTEIPAGTETALAIGPDDEKRIDMITGKLKSL